MFECLVEIISEDIWSLAFTFRMIFYDCFNFLTAYQFIQIFQLFAIQFRKVVFFQELVHFFKVMNPIRYNFSQYSYMILYISAVSVVTSLSFMILSICIFSLFSLASLTKGLLILMVFSKNQFFVAFLFFYSVFSILLNSALIFIFYCFLSSFNFYSDLYYVLTSSYFELNLLLFFQFLKVSAQITDLEIIFFPTV